MTTLTVYDTPRAKPATGTWTRVRKAGATFVVLGALAAVFFTALTKSGADARFVWGTSSVGTGVSAPARPGALVFGLLCVACGVVLLTGRADRWLRWLAGLALTVLVLSFLCWQVAGQAMPLGSTAQATAKEALPLVLGAMCGVLCERSGVINVAIEGQLLTGAFMAALVGTLAASAWAGLLAAAVGGVLIALLLAVLAIRYLVDQVVLGVVLNVLALGLTGFMFMQLMQQHPDKYNFPPTFPTWNIPVLSKIPIVGPALFQSNVFVYVAIVVVVLVHFGLFRTRWGLRTRAVGEHPAAADTVGIDVRRTRYRNVLLGGVIAGLGGASLTVGDVGSFTNNMTNGRGFIALAALIFGRWSPVGATMAALLFGFTKALAGFLPLVGSKIPSEFLNMLPYVVTIVAVAGLVGRVRAPAADGQPYAKG